MSDFRDLVISELADSEAELLTRVDQLLDVVALLAHQNYLLQRAFEHELVERINGDGQLARERRRRYAQRDRTAA